MVRLIALVIFLSFSAQANDELVPDKVESDSKLKVGWNKVLKLNGNIAINSSSGVVGTKDGDSNTFGLEVKAESNFKNESKEWRNGLVLKGATTRTPALPRYVKSADELKLDSIYLHKLESVTWLGPYAKISLLTNIFNGDDIRSTATDYAVFDKDGNALTSKNKTNADFFHLIDGFGVITVKESVGFFAKPVENKSTQLEFRAGLGAIQVMAENQFRIADEESTPIRVEEINSYTEVGFEVGIDYKRKMDDKTKMQLSIEVLYPFNTDKPTALSQFDDIEFTNLESSFVLESKINSWSSMKYQYKVVRQLKVTSDWQNQQDFTLNFNHDFLSH